jgi:hypothetical protein
MGALNFDTEVILDLRSFGYPKAVGRRTGRRLEEVAFAGKTREEPACGNQISPTKTCTEIRSFSLARCSHPQEQCGPGKSDSVGR